MQQMWSSTSLTSYSTDPKTYFLHRQQFNLILQMFFSEM